MLLTLGVLLGPATGSVRAEWGPFAPVSVGGNAVWPAAAMNPHGDALVGWYHGATQTTQIVRRSAGGTFSAPITVSKAGEFGGEPSIGIGDDGEAIVVFTGGSFDNPPEENGVKAAFVSPAGTVSGPVTIGTSDTGTIAPTGLAMDAAGNALAWWTRVGVNGLIVAPRPAGEAFEQPRTLPNPGSRIGRPALAMGRNGHAVAAWASNGRVYAAIGGRDGEFTPAKLLNVPGVAALQPRVAVAPDGSAVVAWVDRTDDAGNGYVTVAYRAAGGDFGPPQTLAEVFYTGVFDVSVAMAPAGEAMVAWNGGLWVPRVDWKTTFAVRPPGGPFATPREGIDAYCNEPPDVAYDSAGNAYAACRRYYGQDDLGQPLGVVLAAARPAAGGGFGPVSELTPPGQNVWEPVLAGGGPGDAVVAWPRGWFPSRFRLEAAVHAGDLLAPPESAASSGGSAAGRPADAVPATPAANPGRVTLNRLLGRLRAQSPQRLLRRLKRGPVRLRFRAPGPGVLGLRVYSARPPRRLLARGRVVMHGRGPATLTLRATRAGLRARPSTLVIRGRCRFQPD